MRPSLMGQQRSDSIATVPISSLLYLRDPDHLIRVMSTNPSFLRSTAGGNATQYRDWGIPLGRRFRSLKMWFQLRIDGIESIQKRLRRDLENAQWLAEQFSALPNWGVVAPVRLQTVCVRHRPVGPDGSQVDDSDEIDTHTREWVRRINTSGDAFLSPAQLDGAWIVRISVGVETTERRHLERLIQMMRAAAETDRGAAA